MSEGPPPLLSFFLTEVVAMIYAADLKVSLAAHTNSIAENLIGSYVGEYANYAQISLIACLALVVGPWFMKVPHSGGGNNGGGGGGKRKHA